MRLGECSFILGAMEQTAFENSVLRRLDADIIGRLDVQQVDLPVNREIDSLRSRETYLFS